MGENAPDNHVEYPDSNSPSLHLTTPTPEERLETWTLTAPEWGKALSLSAYLEREQYLMTVPVARDNGVSHWILVDRNLPPNQRPVLASCESLRKPVLVASGGVVTEGITHGIGSVFSAPEFRGKGYATRMLRELGPILQTWQIDPKVPGNQSCPFSILYSDIGLKYYAKLGWSTFPSTHFAFAPTASSNSDATPLTNDDLPALCAADEKKLRAELANDPNDGKNYVALVPNHDCIQWHHKREDFMTNKVIGSCPTIRGAISTGQPGSRVWAIWTRAYYEPIAPSSGNTLYILRLVVEDEQDTEDNAAKLKGVLALAQAEAGTWQVSGVNVWNPNDVLKGLVKRTGLESKYVTRDTESIACLMWYGEGSNDDVKWVANEKFGWC